MAWEKRAHRCVKPVMLIIGITASYGDVWRCDECGARWQVAPRPDGQSWQWVHA